MQLVESYLLEVAKFLPKHNAGEVLSDLREAIVEEVMDRAEGGDREVRVEDERVVLSGFGHPLQVAARYRPERYLIGPELYPSFLRALQGTALVVVVAYVLVALGAAYTNDWQVAPGRVISSLISLLFWALLAVTAVFVALESAGQRFDWYDRWTPDALTPRVWGAVDRGVIGANLVTEGAYLLWWNDVLILQDWLPFIDGQFVVSLAPIWQHFYWPINLAVGMSFLLNAYLLLRGHWMRWSLITGIVLCMALLGMLVSLSQVDQLVVLNTPMTAYGPYVERAVRVSFLVIAVLLIWDTRWAFKYLVEITRRD